MTRTTKGVLWIVMPFVALFALIVLWPILNFVFVSMSMPGNEQMLTILRVVNLVCGFLGFLSVLFIPIGIVVGIIQLTKKDANVPPAPSTKA